MASGTRHRCKVISEPTSGEEGAIAQNSNMLNNTGGKGSVTTSDTTTTTTTPPVMPDVAQILNQELSTTKLSSDMQLLVTILSKVMQTQFETLFSKITEMSDAKSREIVQLQTKVCALERKITDLENTVDDVDQYERRDTVIISGPALPDESTLENTPDVIVTTIKQHLKLNMTHADINIAHRLGKKTQGKSRPVIVKLQNRNKKHELVQACLAVRPPLFINESLTHKRRELFSVLRKIRSQHKTLFQQCHTSEGKIIVKLKNSSVRHIITNEQSLTVFLDTHPILKNTAENLV